ncbi:GatB/YqeY domain-containing protein [Desulfurispira natronophila]|uniref:GatB/YqeY domain-containing protein n=1 Tax=Desulfurispira natronophila TaxID=682562 RepID=A0A7W8DGC3_9BACT|nr:GatB/YqeY domain-containing protein [Desulfurispira natronophila]MBB5021257.1 hypothetical protein [Desulfurispira natronophila]
MSIKEQVNSDIKQAMRDKNKPALEALRFLMAAFKEYEVNNHKREEGLGDEEALQILQSSIKKRRDSIEQFSAAGRSDLVEKEQAGLAVIERYLPEQLGEDELRAIIQGAIEETGAQGPKGMGLVMKSVMPKVKGKADGGLINRLVKEALG